MKENKDSMDFTFENYKNILLELKKDFIFKNFDDYSEKGSVYLRHDVDVFPENIAAISDIEMECDIRSTFFVLFDSEFYNVLTPRILKIISTVAQNGFAIGLHIDASQFGSLEELMLDIIRKYEYFRNYISLQRIVSFHRPMKELFNNIIIPGSPDKSAVKSSLKHLGSGGSIVIFPEGTRSRTGSLIKMKKIAAMLEPKYRGVYGN